MINENTQFKLATLIKKLSEGEKNIEMQRKLLSENYEFNPYQAFDVLDSLRLSALIPRSIKTFMEDCGETVSDQDLYLLVRQYSSNLNGRLELGDFFQLVLPATNPYLRDLALGRRRHTFESKLSFTVQRSLLRLLQSELALQRTLEDLRLEIYTSPEFSMWKAFKTLDEGSKGFFDEADLVAFLKKFGIYALEDDIDSIFRRVDTGDDMVINYTEFLEGFLPLYVSKETKENERYQKKEEPQVKLEAEELQEQLQEELASEELQQESKEQLVSEELQEEAPLSPEPSPADQKDEELEEIAQEVFETPEKPLAEATFKPQPKTLTYEELDENLKEIIFAFIKEEVYNTRLSEHIKQQLAIQASFTPEKAFKLFNNEQGISIHDMEKKLREFEIETGRDDIWVLFEKFGKNDQESISINPEGLANMLLPKNPEYSALVDHRDEEEPLSSEAIEKLKDALRVELDIERNLENIREQVSDVQEFSLESAFKSISGKDETISADRMKDTVEQAGLELTPTDLSMLMQRFSEDSEITFEGFSKELTPKFSI